MVNLIVYKLHQSNNTNKSFTITIIKNLTNFSLSLQDPRRCLRHAVDAPVRVTVFVADGDGEPPVVGPDDLNRFTGIAKDGH